MSEERNYMTYFDHVDFSLPRDAVIDCSHQGECDDDVEYWQSKLNLNLDREKMIKELNQYGAWDYDELHDLDDDELEQKLIWIAACNIKESDDFKTDEESES